MPAKKFTRPRIVSIKINMETDTDPDFSCIGTYTDNLDPWNILRDADEYVANLPEDYKFPDKSNTYRCFRPYAGGEEPGSDDYQKYGKQDYKRMEALSQGEWGFIGITATAEVQCPNNRIQTFTSGSLWGIESDSGWDYLKSVMQDELSDLKEQLATFFVNMAGFDAKAKAAIDEAMSK